MKSLFIIRHANASIKQKHLSDEERPLKKRGIANANKICDKLKSQNLVCEQIYTSPAIRAQTTADIFHKNLFPNAKMKVKEELYECNHTDIYHLLKRLPDDLSSLAIVGHNPSITGIANFLCIKEIDPIPPSGFVHITLPVEKWQDLEYHIADVSILETPEKDT